jgi:hypothetical protein
VITLDFSTGVIAKPFKPLDDDKLTRNDVTVKRDGGSRSFAAALEEGRMSVQDPPDGVGRYDVEETLCLEDDDQAASHAYWRMHLGTFDGLRYTKIKLKLGNPRVYAMVNDILRADVGDKIRITNLPAGYGPGDVDLIIRGYSEELGSDWSITFNCAPGEPWTVGVLEDADYSRADTAGCELAEALDTTETGVDVLTTAVSRWVDSATYASDFPFDVLVGGELMTVTACTGTGLSQTFTVTRSVNGIVKSHATGTDVRLAQPTTVAL